MIWLGKSFIKFCRSIMKLIKLMGTQTCCSARVRKLSEAEKLSWICLSTYFSLLWTNPQALICILS